MRRPLTFILILACLLFVSLDADGRPGGGGRGGRGGGGGRPGGFGRGFNPGDFQKWREMWDKMRQQNEQMDEKAKAEKLKQKLEKTLADGWAALRVHDTAAAMDCFSDVLDLQPENPMAKLGMGLSYAQKARFSQAQSGLEAAGRAKADQRLVSYNLAVVHSRQGTKGRAIVILNRLITETKPIEEMMVNAQRTLVATLDDKSRSLISSLPVFLKALENANMSLKSAHAPLERWGMIWMPAEEVAKHRTAGEKEAMPTELPFLMPGDEPLPEKGKAMAINPLLPQEMRDGVIAAAPVMPEVPKPTEVATNTAPKVNGSFQLGGGGSSTQTPATPVRNEPTVPTPTPDPVTPRRVGITRTVSGAAFAVSPDLFLTCSRLTENARSIQIQTMEGKAMEATVVASDPAVGIALIKVEGGKFSPIPLADSAKSGLVSIASFSKASVFAPSLDLLRGELYGPAGKMTLRANTHPRSAGSPLINSDGDVVGILSATRDDPTSSLPVITIDQIQAFVKGKFPDVDDSANPDPSHCIVELLATRIE